MSGENGDVTERYTLGVGERPLGSTPVGDVFRHLSTSFIDRVDGVGLVSDTGPILTVEAA